MDSKDQGQVKKKRIEYVHTFRGLAILAIIASHITTTMTWMPDSLSERILVSLFTESTILFMLVSGFLFRHLMGRKGLWDYYKNKFIKIILPYIVISIPALFWTIHYHYQVELPAYYYERSTVELVGTLLLTGIHMGPYWYMPTIAVFFLCAPLFIWMERKTWPYLFVVPLLILSFFLRRNFLFAWWDFPILTNALSNFIFYSPIYILGMMASRYEEAIHVFCERYKILLLAVTGIVFLAACTGGYDVGFFTRMNKLLMAVLLFHFLCKFPMRAAAARVMSYTADVSFGLFFIHGYVVGAERMAWRHFTKGELPEGNMLLFLASYVLVTLLSFGAVALIKKLTGKKSRFIVGC